MVIAKRGRPHPQALTQLNEIFRKRRISGGGSGPCTIDCDAFHPPRRTPWRRSYSNIPIQWQGNFLQNRQNVRAIKAMENFTGFRIGFSAGRSS
jgi:hypothetical protein